MGTGLLFAEAEEEPDAVAEAQSFALGLLAALVLVAVVAGRDHDRIAGFSAPEPPEPPDANLPSSSRSYSRSPPIQYGEREGREQPPRHPNATRADRSESGR